MKKTFCAISSFVTMFSKLKELFFFTNFLSLSFDLFLIQRFQNKLTAHIELKFNKNQVQNIVGSVTFAVSVDIFILLQKKLAN